MTPQMFLALGLKAGDRVTATLGTPSGGSRRVRLYFRGFRTAEGRSVARGADDIVPLFSPPSSKGGMNKKYYTSLSTSFPNILSIETDGATSRFAFIRTGALVRWNDPGIGDFDPEERAAQAACVYTVTDACWSSSCPSAGDETVLISDGYGDAEVPAAELLPTS